MSKRRNGPRSAAEVERDIRAAPGKNGPGPVRPSILAEIAASPTARAPKWAFTPEQLADIDEAFAALDAGTINIGMGRLARILKSRYDLPWAVVSIRDRLLDIKSSRSTRP